MSRIDESKDFIPVRIAVLTVSDTRTLADDRSGRLVVEVDVSGRIAKHIGSSAQGGLLGGEDRPGQSVW